MNLGKKLTHYLRDAHIDFTTFDVVDIAPQPDDHAVVILAHKDQTIKYPRFNVQYKGTNAWYESLERLLDVCVELKYYNKLEAAHVLAVFNGKEEE